ncbi:conserved hypothetical protein [Burkholderiales bacterium 8X]|nr:conserved hypothetical protein [Burkholderiales bacterium 8X]
MKETDLAASIERIMRQVDYYLHCELDEEYDRDLPELARQLLEDALRAELQRAGAIGMVSSLSAIPSVVQDAAAVPRGPFKAV